MAYRFAGKQKLLSIGPYPTIGLREARDKREEAKRQLLANIDPSGAKREAKATAAEAALNSFEVVAREWFDGYSASWTPAYRRYMRQRLEKNIFPYMGAAHRKHHRQGASWSTAAGRGTGRPFRCPSGFAGMRAHIPLRHHHRQGRAGRCRRPARRVRPGSQGPPRGHHRTRRRGRPAAQDRRL